VKKSHVRNFSGKASREKISREKIFWSGLIDNRQLLLRQPHILVGKAYAHIHLAFVILIEY